MPVAIYPFAMLGLLAHEALPYVHKTKTLPGYGYQHGGRTPQPSCGSPQPTMSEES